MAIKEDRRKSSASPNWLAMIDAMELPVEVIESGMLFVLPISMVTVIVSPNARPMANTYDEKYGANDVRPGLTGWAQINGRDELEIPVKARLDGEYVQRLSFLFDCKCFFGTIVAVLKHDGVVEGGTGSMQDRSK